MPFSRLPSTVLVVDDDDGTRSSLRRLLKLDKYVVDEAASVRELFDREDWSKYFAVLLDRRLPDGSADEVLARLKEVAPGASIVIVTGHADIEGSIAALRAGAADYLLKPIEPASLRARLKGLDELWRSRAEVAQRDKQFEFIVENLPAAAAYVNNETEAVQFNSRVREVTGYGPEDLTTIDTCFDKLFPEVSKTARMVYERARGRSLWSDGPRKIEITHRDGSKRTLEFRGYRYDDHEVWMLQDITQRERHETELRIRDRAIQAAAEGIAIADATRPGHPLIFANEAFQSMTGYALEQIVGKGCEILFGSESDTGAFDRFQQAITDGREFSQTIQCTRQDGTRYWNSISAAPVRDSRGRVSHVVAVTDDVTDQRRAEVQLLQSERLAAIGQMVTGLAHESRNALQRARACLDLLALDFEDDAEQFELSEKIRRALDDLQRNYEEVRNYAAPIILERREVSLDAIWQRVWQDLEGQRSGRDVELLVQKECADLKCRVDEHRVEQVFRNVIENSLAACSDPGKLEITCAPATILKCDAMRITFRDNGPGFDADTSARVFQPFFTTKQKGTGLGMAISKRIVEAHNGFIGLGVQDGGAEVFIELPRD